MARYRKIDTRIWNDQKFRALSDDGKLVFLFILSHPHLTSLGAMRATVSGLAAELGWPLERLRKAFAKGIEKGLIEHDQDASFIALPKFLKYNGPESPNVVKSWSDSLDLIPECHLKHLLMQRVKGFAEALPEAFAKALPEAFRKGMPYQEQEPEQEQKQEPDTPHSPPGGKYAKAFLDWWEAYPRKIGKDRAYKAWKSAGKRIRLQHELDWQTAAERMLDAAKDFSVSIVGQSRYCPHPATWLNAGQYDDDRNAWNRAEEKSPRDVEIPQL